MNTELFANRHIGIREKDLPHMLGTIGVDSLDQLIDQTIPKDIRLGQKLDLRQEIDENSYLAHLEELAQKNKQFKTYIGLGYHQSITPSPIKRNILENPGWYTAY